MVGRGYQSKAAVMGERARHLMPSSRQPRFTAARLLRGGLAVVTAVVVAVTGFGWWTLHGMLTGITVSQALGADAPHSAGAAVNILLIGLDSRKDQNGDDLPQDVLDQLHAGDSTSGGYNTNTLILVHLAEDGSVEAFSIPRDDYVSVKGIVPGYDHIKIKEAYGLTKADEEQKLVDDGESDRATLEKQGREAGRKATLAVVRSLTGVPIDYFAEVNLAGFYDVAASLGGVEVCLNHAVHDSYSGADFPAGRQTLDARQALAFVRQRHGLDNGDLDRTHRQQAFLISVIRQLQGSGSFSDMGKLDELMDVARKDIVLSSGWDQSLFRRIGSLSGEQVHYQTLPVVRYDTVYGQDVNIVDPAAIRALVKTHLRRPVGDAGSGGACRRHRGRRQRQRRSRSCHRGVEHPEPPGISRRRAEPRRARSVAGDRRRVRNGWRARRPSRRDRTGGQRAPAAGLRPGPRTRPGGPWRRLRHADRSRQLGHRAVGWRGVGDRRRQTRTCPSPTKACPSAAAESPASTSRAPFRHALRACWTDIFGPWHQSYAQSVIHPQIRVYGEIPGAAFCRRE